MSGPRERLRIALQKSGRLAGPSLELLRRIGLVFRESKDRLFLHGENLPVDVLLVRDDDIPGLLAEGSCELGIVGRNVLAEYGQDMSANSVLLERAALGFGRCRLALAAPEESGINAIADLQGARIATSYPNALRQWLLGNGIDARIVTLSGSVEIAPRLGKADAICDLVSTGATLAANHLRELTAILDSEATLAVRATALAPSQRARLDQFCARIDSVLSCRGTRMLMLEAPRTSLSAITRLFPVRECLSVLSVDGQPDAIALQAYCNDSPDWQELETLKRLGARNLMVLSIEQVLA